MHRFGAIFNSSYVFEQKNGFKPIVGRIGPFLVENVKLKGIYNRCKVSFDKV